MWSSNAHGYEPRTGHMGSVENSEQYTSYIENLLGVKDTDIKEDGCSQIKFNENKIFEIIFCDNKPYIFWKESWVHLSSAPKRQSGDDRPFTDEFIDSMLDMFKSRYEVTELILISKILNIKEGSKKQQKEATVTSQEGYVSSFLGWMMGISGTKISVSEESTHKDKLVVKDKGLEEIGVNIKDDQKNDNKVRKKSK